MEENNRDLRDKELEEITYETRFLLNILLDLLVKKNVFTEEEFSKEYDNVLQKINKSTSQKN